MKAISKHILALSIIFISAISFSCASKGTVTSSVSSDHLTVEQTTTGIYIVLEKAADEDIQKIELTDDAGSYACVPMDSKKNVSFPWPFAEYKKSYTITALLSGIHSSSKESVSFTVENDVAPAISYTDDYLNSKLSLNAVGNERLLRFYTTSDKLSSAFGKSKVKSSILNLNVFSGSRFNDSDSATLVADWDINLANNNTFETITKGYDLIKNAQRFGVSPSALNEALKKNETYFAKAAVSFALAGSYPAGLEFHTAPIFTNDTVYTALDADEIPVVRSDEK